MKLVELTILILELSALIDSGRYEGVTIEEVEEHIESGDLFIWLKARFPSLDLSLHQPRGSRNAAQEITDALNDILGGYGGSEGRKWGIRNNGICLLLSWINELIQQRKFSD
jgi:hypothetical protein